MAWLAKEIELEKIWIANGVNGLYITTADNPASFPVERCQDIQGIKQDAKLFKEAILAKQNNPNTPETVNLWNEALSRIKV